MGLFDWISGALQKVGETINQGIANFERATGVDIPIVGTDLSKEKKPAPTPTPPTPTIPQVTQKPEFKPEMTHTTAVPKDYVPITVSPSPTPTPKPTPTGLPSPARVTPEDVKRVVETAVKMAEETAKNKGISGAVAMTQEELQARGLKPWEKVEYISTAYEKVGEEKREVGKIRTEFSPTQITKEIVFSEAISPEELKRIQEQLKQAGFQVTAEVKDNKLYLRGIAKAEGEYFLRPEFLEEVKGEPTKPYFEIEGKKYYLKEDIKPLIEEIPIEVTYEVKEPTSYIAVVGEDIEKIQAREKAIEQFIKEDIAGTFGIGTFGMIWSYGAPEAYYWRPRIFYKGLISIPKGEEGRKEFIRELAKKQIELEQPYAPLIESAKGFTTATATLLLSTGIDYGMTKLAVAHPTASKVMTGILRGIGLGATGYYIGEPLIKGETEEAITRALGIGFLAPLAISGSQYGRAKALEKIQPQKVIAVGTKEGTAKSLKIEQEPGKLFEPSEKLTRYDIAREITTRREWIPSKEELVDIVTKGKTVFEGENIRVKALGNRFVIIAKKDISLPTTTLKEGEVLDVITYDKLMYGRKIDFIRSRLIPESQSLDISIAQQRISLKFPVKYGEPISEEFKPTFFKGEKSPPDVLKDVLFIRKPFSKEYYVFRPKELFRPEFWKSLPSKIKAMLFKPKPAPTEVPSPSPAPKVVKAPEPTFTAGSLGLETVETYYPVAIEITPATPKAPGIILPIYPAEPTIPYQPALETEVKQTGLDIIDPLIAGRRAILMSIEREMQAETKKEIPEKAKERIPELPRRPEEFPVIAPVLIEVEKARRPEEFPIGSIPVQATAKRELLAFKQKLAKELKGEEIFKPVAIIQPIPKRKYFIATYTTQEMGLVPELALKELLQSKLKKESVKIPIEAVPIIPPIPSLPEGFDIGKFTWGEVGGRKERYEPSLEAIFFGIKVPKEKVRMPKKLTGFELRPEII